MSSTSPPSLVLMTADSREGVWGHSLELARALAPHGVSVALGQTASARAGVPA